MKTMLIISLLVMGTLAQNFTNNSNVVAEFHKFMKEHNKVYETREEYNSKFAVFKKNFEKLQADKLEHDRANDGSEFTFGVTQFFDMTEEEFQTQYLTLDLQYFKNFHADCDKEFEVEGHEAEDEVDHTTTGHVNAVKNQASCGSCWAFSTISNIESQYFRKTGELLDLSEQQLVDCDGTNGGCNGGLMDTAIEYFVNTKSASQEDYKYTARDGKCQKDIVAKGKKLGVAGCIADQTHDEEAIKKAVHKYGPMAIAVDANSFFSYTGGILKRGGNQLNHAVNIVGYGEEDGVKFWKVRNSWGATWGEKGYVRILRGSDVCGISQYVLSTYFK